MVASGYHKVWVVKRSLKPQVYESYIHVKDDGNEMKLVRMINGDDSDDM